jgi:hypothetical protein
LAIDRAHPQCEVAAREPGVFPFAQKDEPLWDTARQERRPYADDVPVIRKLKARVAPEWRMNGANAGPVPQSPVQVSTEETTVELIPYGCSRLRISEFPTTSP